MSKRVSIAVTVLLLVVVSQHLRKSRMEREAATLLPAARKHEASGKPVPHPSDSGINSGKRVKY
ncbi:hypothetical protein [Niabella sp.]|uniref:hypothetical protein n=1 Tax=Niabella sp. TaxID=1962976 RepID=UPI0026297BFC|nr:hypothetical protein [Niabella sp.]